MNKLVKIILSCLGIGLVVGLGIWAELNSGEYTRLQGKDGKVSVKEAVRIDARN